jgi:hypothetical protein
MRENRLSGSEGGGPQPNAASLPLSPGELLARWAETTSHRPVPQGVALGECPSEKWSRFGFPGAIGGEKRAKIRQLGTSGTLWVRNNLAEDVSRAPHIAVL